MQCAAVGYPSPIVNFKKDGVEITKSFSNNSLVIMAQVNDTGNYSCTSNNTMGSKTSNYEKFEVLCKYYYSIRHKCDF